MLRHSSSQAKPLVSVVTPSIPERSAYLIECERSVEYQTFEQWEHLVQIDVDREGCAKTVNRLAAEARGEWLLICADDDVMLPRCLAILLEHSEDADIVYSPPLVWRNGSNHFFGVPPYIPSFGLIHMELWRELGGYDEGVIREEDRGFWTKAIEVGAKFVRADSEPTWVYRFSFDEAGNPRNKSYASGVSR